MKHRDVYLSVLGILIIIVATIGISFAYLSAAAVSGNDTTNRIATTVAKYGDLVVGYHNASGVISLGAIDLPESTAGTNIHGIMKFKVTSTEQTAPIVKYTIKWAGESRVTNTFCQYANTNTYECVDPATTGTNVSYAGDEITYRLYKCTDETNYNNATPTFLTGCTALIDETAAPYSVAERGANIVTGEEMTPTGTNYYVIVLTIYNKITPQDYQQGRTFIGAINVVGETN